MSSSFTIELKNLRFFAEHGLYAEEAAAGNEFEINIALTTKAPETTLISLEETINYAAVYQTVKDIFTDRQALLETVAMNIAAALKKRFPALRKASVQITKLHPPISYFNGSVSVTYKKKFND